MAGDGGMRPWLEQQAGSQGLPVRFPGYISESEYVRMLKADDFVVIPQVEMNHLE